MSGQKKEVVLTSHGHNPNKEVDVALGENDVLGRDFLIRLLAQLPVLPGGVKAHPQDDQIKHDHSDQTWTQRQLL